MTQSEKIQGILLTEKEINFAPVHMYPEKCPNCGTKDRTYLHHYGLDDCFGSHTYYREKDGIQNDSHTYSVNLGTGETRNLNEPGLKIVCAATKIR